MFASSATSALEEAAEVCADTSALLVFVLAPPKAAPLLACVFAVVDAASSASKKMIKIKRK